MICDAVELSLPHQAPAALRSAGRASRLRSGRRSCLRPAPPGLRRRAPTCETSRAMSRDRRAPTLKACLRRGRSGSEMAGAPSASAGRMWRARGAPIPPAVDPGRAEQTWPLASRSFVQWRAPPGRQEPRPLHGVWVDGRRDGSWVVGGLTSVFHLPCQPDLVFEFQREVFCSPVWPGVDL